MAITRGTPVAKDLAAVWTAMYKRHYHLEEETKMGIGTQKPWRRLTDPEFVAEMHRKEQDRPLEEALQSLEENQKD
jgi:hypothetical protein